MIFKKGRAAAAVMILLAAGFLFPQHICIPSFVYAEEKTDAAENTEGPNAQEALGKTNPANPDNTASRQPQPAVRINKSRASLEKGDKIRLKAAIKNTNKNKIVWRSSRKRVASVNKKGIVKARNKGKTTITAAIKGTGIKASCTVQVKKYITMRVRTTGYCNCSRCAGPWAGSRTASGARPRARHTIAVDTRLIDLGTKVKIDGITYVAEDTGSAIRGRKIDIYYRSHRQALSHGVQYEKAKIYF